MALKIFCRKINISGASRFSEPGPLLLVANHPNSFFDAILIGALFHRPVHFLARGDAFNKPRHGRLLRFLNMIPVYRLSEGKDNLPLNETAFRRSKEVLAQNGIVLIFIEGICVHKHELQPFKKGAARIAWESRNKEGFRVLPMGLAYDSFERFGKNINLYTGELLLPSFLFPFLEEARNIRHFNGILQHEIEKRIVLPAKEPKDRNTGTLLLLPMATLGYMINQPFYRPIKKILITKTAGTVFYDSVLFGILLLLYPVFLLILSAALLVSGISLTIVLLIFLFFPLSAYCAVQWRSTAR
ncbi:MAG: 1-acyl-sn-glycerol-3-phosphate acyltransferase [Bacteroidota bacterium]